MFYDVKSNTGLLSYSKLFEYTLVMRSNEMIRDNFFAFAFDRRQKFLGVNTNNGGVEVSSPIRVFAQCELS